jgi:putative membrane protein
MKENMRKITAVALSAVMIVSAFTGCEKKKAEPVMKEETDATQNNDENDEKNDMKKAEEMAAPEHSSTSGKNETVYVIKNSDGTKKTIVSAWLKNPNGSASMKDVSDLENIEVVKGDAKMEKNENGNITWNAAGADVYYSGTTQKNSPVDVDITYTLNGAKVNASELKGKSGHLVIDIKYSNTMSKTVTGKDKKEYTIYMPFIMSTGMILDNAKFSNITAKNGEVVNDGDHTMVMGIGFPGLYDSLGLDTIDFSKIDKDKKIERSDIPDSVTIECDVKDCDEFSALTVAKTFDINKISKTYDIGKLDADIDDMTDGMKKLIDGSEDLHTGISKVNKGVKSLQSGARTLSSGADSIAKGAKKLSSGTNSLVSGAKDLNDGMSKLNKALPSESDAKKLAAGSAQIKNAIDSMHSAAKNAPVTDKDVAALQAKLYKLVQAGELDADTMKQIITVYKTCEGLENGVNSIYSGYGSVNKAVQAYPQIVSGIGSASKGAKQIAEGAQTLNKGAKDLSGGADKLAKGAKSLKNGTGTLADGTEKLLRGSKDLKDGLKKFDDKAVDKVADLIRETVDPLSDRFEALKAYSNTYGSFAGSDNAVECSTVFVFKNN